MSSDILQMCEMLEVQTKNYIFKSFADCRGCVERALKDGAVFSVGGAWTDPWAKRLGLPHVIVENSVETILNALESATQLRRVQVEEAEKQCLFKTQSEMYQAVLDFTHDAILAIDENGRIQVLNPPAERIMGCRAADSVGQPVEAGLPNTLLPDVLESGEKQLDQIMQIHQTLCNTNRIPILVDGQRRWCTQQEAAYRQMNEGILAELRKAQCCVEECDLGNFQQFQESLRQLAETINGGE